jgi:Fe-S cluster biosynthesis and repair protein YggX
MTDSTSNPPNAPANPAAKSPRLVMCKKFGREMIGLPFKPFPTPFGQELYEHVSHEAWKQWLKESPRYINTYRIDLQTADGRAFLEKQMRVFFGFDEGQLAETAWRPKDE